MVLEYADISVECSDSSNQVVDLATNLLTRSNQVCHAFEVIRCDSSVIEVDEVIINSLTYSER